MALPAAIALSGLTPEHFSDDLTDVYKHGALLLKSPKLASVVSNSVDIYSQEKDILVMPNERRTSVAKNLEHLFNMILKSQEMESQVAPPELPSPKPNAEIIRKRGTDVKITYHSRDILDLASNIEWKWDFKIATIQDGTEFFFANRSQYSRVSGAHIPEHVMNSCSFEDCEYQEPDYK